MEESIRGEEFKNECRDCTVRALAVATDLPYSKVHDAWAEVGRKNKHGIVAEKYLQKVCKILNVKAKQVKRHGTVKSLIKKFPVGKLYCHKSRHAFAIVDGTTYDLNSLDSHVKGAWLITNF